MTNNARGTQDTTIGAEIRRLRMAQSLTPGKLATKSGVSARTIDRLESGATKAPNIDTLEKLGEALHADVIALLSLAHPGLRARLAPVTPTALAVHHGEPEPPTVIADSLGVLSKADLRVIAHIARIPLFRDDPDACACLFKYAKAIAWLGDSSWKEEADDDFKALADAREEIVLAQVLAN